MIPVHELLGSEPAMHIQLAGANQPGKHKVLPHAAIVHAGNISPLRIIVSAMLALLATGGRPAWPYAHIVSNLLLHCRSTSQLLMSFRRRRKTSSEPILAPLATAPSGGKNQGMLLHLLYLTRRTASTASCLRSCVHVALPLPSNS